MGRGELDSNPPFPYSRTPVGGSIGEMCGMHGLVGARRFRSEGQIDFECVQFYLFSSLLRRKSVGPGAVVLRFSK